MRNPPSKRTGPFTSDWRVKKPSCLSAVRQIFLVAAQVDIDVEELDAACPAPTATLVLDDIGAHLAALGEEAGANLALGVELVVVIFRNPPAKFEDLEEAADGNVGANVAARLAPVERGCSASSSGSSEKRIGTPYLKA